MRKNQLDSYPIGLISASEFIKEFGMQFVKSIKKEQIGYSVNCGNNFLGKFLVSEIISKFVAKCKAWKHSFSMLF